MIQFNNPEQSYNQAEPWDWPELTDVSALAGKQIAEVDYDDPFMTIFFADGSALYFYGMSAQSSDKLLVRFAPRLLETTPHE